jgi:hypothetical protein
MTELNIPAKWDKIKDKTRYYAYAEVLILTVLTAR